MTRLGGEYYENKAQQVTDASLGILSTFSTFGNKEKRLRTDHPTIQSTDTPKNTTIVGRVELKR